MKSRRHDLARRHLLRAVDMAPKGWIGGSKAGDLLFQLGEFVAAIAAIRTAAPHSARDPKALLTLSAIQQRHGDRSIARELLVHAAQLRPIRRPTRLHPENPTILRIRSVDASSLRIKLNDNAGIYRRQLTGGHFSIRNLLDGRRFNLYCVDLTAGHEPPAGDLPHFDLLINAISCPDKNPGGLNRAVAWIAALPTKPMINDPKNVLRTTRAENARRIGGIGGVRFPRTVLVRVDTALQKVCDRIEALEIGYPMILRIPGSQTGVSVELIRSRNDLLSYLSGVPMNGSVYVIEYFDCRGDKGFFHKTRAFFIDGKFFPVANLTSSEWQIHSGDRYIVMSSHAWMQEREKQYLVDPATYLGHDNFRRLQDINKLLQLDFVGVDFTISRAGDLIVFEANAAMRHNFDHVAAFPYTVPHLEDISSAFQKMVETRICSR